MKRKIYESLLEWKQSANGKTAIMIDGARRVGKSWIAEEFARTEYEAYLLIDFSKVSTRVKRYFNEYMEDLDTFFMYLLNTYGVHLPRRKSVIIFDEVQRFPRAREAIKWLIADGRYDYIETGSLISINKNVRDIVIPSEERHLEMYPMDFEEFLWAMGRSNPMESLEFHFARKKPLDGGLHETMMDLFRQYLVVGGMPQAVETFVQTRDFDAVDRVKRDILALYRADIHKYSGTLRHKVLSMFNLIPAELSKHEKKFTLSDVKKGTKMRDLDSALEWLKGAMTVNVCYAASEPTVALGMKVDAVSFKCYLGDTGLLLSMAFEPAAMRAGKIHERILHDSLSLDKGMLMENVVAQMFRAAGHGLFFYSASDRACAANRMEIDFLLCKPTLTRQHNIIPVEVKSGRDYETVSLGKFRKKFHDQTQTAVVLHVKNLKVENGIVYLPLYMAPLLVTRPL